MSDFFTTRRDEIEARTATSAELMSKEVFTEEEVAELFGLSPFGVRQAVRAGELPATMAGDQIAAIRRDDLLDWMRRRGGS